MWKWKWPHFQFLNKLRYIDHLKSNLQSSKPGSRRNLQLVRLFCEHKIRENRQLLKLSANFYNQWQLFLEAKEELLQWQFVELQCKYLNIKAFFMQAKVYIVSSVWSEKIQKILSLITMLQLQLKIRLPQWSCNYYFNLINYARNKILI